MSAETFTTAMFLITAVLAAGVLINAVFPVVYNMASTFQTATHESDQRLRTDFKIVATLAQPNSNTAKVWMKNIGSSRIAIADLQRCDVFAGTDGDFEPLKFDGTSVPKWTALTPDLANTNFWSPGETIEIDAYSQKIPVTSGSTVYYQFILPDGIWRSTDFTVSNSGS
jgi:archaeal flagellar protein FlaG